MAGKTQKVSGGGRKIGRNKKKCEKYRLYVGKPNGRGKPGQKAGKHR